MDTVIKHLLDVRELSPQLVIELFELARQLRDDLNSASTRLRGKLMASLFFEASTRTRLSFEAAMLRMGGQIISTVDAASNTSSVKGESLEDTIRIVSGYADVIVLRHPQVEAAARAAAVSEVPIINAGNGGSQHPTQALLDLFTIQEELGRLSELKVVVTGDLVHSRCIRSFVLLLTRFPDNQLIFATAPGLELGVKLKEDLHSQGVRWQESHDLSQVLPQADVVYANRLQKERVEGGDFRKLPSGLIINQEAMKLLNPKAILMDPLPRIDEIAPEVDLDPRAVYFRQSRNGLWIRMALLEMLLS